MDQYIVNLDSKFQLENEGAKNSRNVKIPLVSDQSLFKNEPSPVKYQDHSINHDILIDNLEDLIDKQSI